MSRASRCFLTARLYPAGDRPLRFGTIGPMAGRLTKGMLVPWNPRRAAERTPAAHRGARERMSFLPRRRTVADVMTTSVHIAGPQTPFKLLVRLIEENRVSAIPIVDQQGVPIGVVSETGLLMQERRTDFRDAGVLSGRRARPLPAKADGMPGDGLM